MSEYAYIKADKEHFDKIFHQLEYGLGFAGGDGDVALYLRWHDYKEVAELYKHFEIEYTDKTKHKMTEIYEVREVPEEEKVVFERMNESVTIGRYNPDTFNAHPYAEMVIIH